MGSEGLPETGDLVDGRYRIQAVIGRGGMGVVFGARDEKESRDVALKILAPESTASVQRFLREARVLAGIESEHVVRVFGAGTCHGAPYFVMERLRGVELGVRVRREGRLPLVEVADVIVQACEALAHAHAAGVVHRDVKTSNLFAHDTPQGPIVKVLDFGVARAPADIDLRLTGTQDAGYLGSTPYMSPEQVKDPRKVDARSDLWALGVVAVRLLTTAFPFGESPRAEVLDAIRTRRAPRIADLGVVVPEEVEAAIAKCLAPEPSARFADAGELAAAFAPFTSTRFRHLHERVRAALAPAPTRRAAPPDATAPIGPPGSETETAFDASATQVDVTAGAPTPHAALRTIGRFVVEGTLGTGGMGEVYAAWDPTLERRVALKILKKKDVETKKRRVLREARAAAALTHPNTVTIFEVGEADGEVFIAMELLSGKTLRAAAQEATLAQKLRWLLEAARALAAAHERGLVHRDVKPDNMFVCKDGTLKLLDFGIAKRDDDASGDGTTEPEAAPHSLRTASGRRIGTPRYMAPEQRAGTPTDARTDQYAWALVAYESLTGDHAVESAATIDVEDRALPERRVRRLREVAPELDGGAIATIERALSPKKDDRFPSMAPVVEALEHALSQITTTSGDRAPARAFPPPEPPRRRRRIALVGVGAVALLGAAIFGATHLLPRSAPARSARPPTRCSVVAAHDVPAVDASELAVLPENDGVLFTSRFGDQGLVEESHVRREVDGGLEPWSPGFGLNFRNARIRTLLTTLGPLVVANEVDEHGGVTFLRWTNDPNGYAISRGTVLPASAVDAAMFEDRLLVTFGGGRADDSPLTRTLEMMVYTADGGMTRHKLLEEETNFELPTLAVSGRRAAVAFLRGKVLSIVLLDADANRFGEAIDGAEADGAAAAWVGDALVAFHTTTVRNGRVLRASALHRDSTALDPPVAVTAEAIAGGRIYAVAAPKSGPFLVWPAIAGRRVAIHIAHIAMTPDGPALDAPLEIASTSGARHLTATSTRDGAVIAWLDDDVGKFRVSRVVCPP